MGRRCALPLLAAVMLSLFSSVPVFAQTGWVARGDSWEYYNGDGTLAKSQWVISGGSLFWITEDGTMASSEWVEFDNQWYWFDAGGTAVTGWQQIDGKWYYFHDDYSMAANETIGSYYVGRDGAWNMKR